MEPVVIVGGGNSAAQAAIHFAKYARRVTMVVRQDSLKSTVSSYPVDRMASVKNVEVRTNTEVVALDGDEILRSVAIRQRNGNTMQTVDTRCFDGTSGGLGIGVHVTPAHSVWRCHH